MKKETDRYFNDEEINAQSNIDISLNSKLNGFKNYLRNELKSNQHFSPVFNYLFINQMFRNSKISDYFKKRLKEGVNYDELEKEFINRCKIIKVPIEIVNKNFSIDIFIQNSLFNFLIEKYKKEELKLPQVYNEDYIGIVLEDIFYHDFIKSDYQNRSINLNWYILNWLNEVSYREMIQRRLKHGGDVNEISIQVLEIWNRFLRNNFSQLVKLYRDILLYIFEARRNPELESQFNNLKRFVRALENGTQNKVTSKLLMLGLNRTYSIEVSKIIREEFKRNENYYDNDLTLLYSDLNSIIERNLIKSEIKKELQELL